MNEVIVNIVLPAVGFVIAGLLTILVWIGKNIAKDVKDAVIFIAKQEEKNDLNDCVHDELWDELAKHDDRLDKHDDLINDLKNKSKDS